MTINPKELRMYTEYTAPLKPGNETEGKPLPPQPGGYHWMDQMIQEAMAKGEFDNLPGKGKPLDFGDDPDPYDTEGNWMVNKILKEAKILPEWIELDKEIRKEVAWLRANPADHPERRSRIIDLNAKIQKHNLVCPPSVQKPKWKE